LNPSAVTWASRSGSATQRAERIIVADVGVWPGLWLALVLAHIETLHVDDSFASA